MKKIPDVFSCNSNTRRCFLKQFWQESFRLKQRPLRDSNPILQQSSTPVGLSAREKKRRSTNREQFWLSGSPEVITDGAIRQKTKFPIFPFLKTMCSGPCIWRRFGVPAKKNEISENES